MTRALLRSRRAVVASTAAAALVAAAACGRGANQSAVRNGADTTSADKSVVGAAPVGSMKPQMDSALAQGRKTIDSLHAAGVTSKNGIDSTISKVQATTANEPGRDTAAHINNRATPGQLPAGGASGGAKRP